MGQIANRFSLSVLFPKVKALVIYQLVLKNDY